MALNATIHLDTHHHVGAIDRRIFGGFLEHLGRAVYQGVYDPGSPLADADGFRHDVIDTLKHLHMPLVRYPGGNFVSCYNWRDGIGPRDQRPSRPDFAWKSIETNQFGTDEFMQWCKLMNTEPMMAVNLGTGSPSDAADLLEYCNLDTATAYAAQRRANGHPDPYNVKIWCLGNEMDGPWQAGHRTATEYARSAWQASKLMKGLDDSIQTIVCGSSARSMPTYLEWDRTVIEECWDTTDFISAHRYSSNAKNDTPAFLAEGVEIDRILADYDGLINYVRGLKRSDKAFHVSFDEWNVWYRARGGDGSFKQAPHLLEEVYNLEDALVCAQYLMAFIRRADLVKIACLAQIVNVIAPILTKTDGLLVQSIYHPIELISESARGVSLRVALDCPTYKAGARGDCPAIDAAASFDPDSGEIAVFVVNRQVDAPATVEIHLADRKLTKILSAAAIGGQDPKTANSWDQPNAVARFAPDTKLSEDKLQVTLKPCGFAAIRVASEKI